MAKRKHNPGTPDRAARNPAGIFTPPEGVPCLDSDQLARLDTDFREWADTPRRSDVRMSRKRILFIFLMIRHTAARLGEVLECDAAQDIDLNGLCVHLQSAGGPRRTVPISPESGAAFQRILDDFHTAAARRALTRMDPGHVRRKFYERAQSCGFPRDAGTPTALRRARAVELLRSNVPLPVVQKILGHSTPGLTAACIGFSDADMIQVVRRFVDSESRRKTSARNIFYGRITSVIKGDIQSQVDVATMSGARIRSVITNDSALRLNVRRNNFVTAEVKAPWVVVCAGAAAPQTTACNMFQGEVETLVRGKVTSEVVVRLHDDTRICSIITGAGPGASGLHPGAPAWVLFNAFAVILYAD